VNHTKRMRAMNELQTTLDHPAPASRKKKAKAATQTKKKKTDQLARVNFTNAGPGRILKSGEYTSGGVFIGGQYLRKDAPATFGKSTMDNQVETMINEINNCKLVTRSEVEKHRDMCLAHGRVTASLVGDFQMHRIEAEGGCKETASPMLFGGGAMFKVCWADVVLNKAYEETTQIVTKEFLETYFHDLYFDLIVCNKEQHEHALLRLAPWHFSYQTPLAFWSVIFHSRGDRGIVNCNTFEWKKALACAANTLDWDGIFDKRSWDKKNYDDSSQEEEESE